MMTTTSMTLQKRCRREDRIEFDKMISIDRIAYLILASLDSKSLGRMSTCSVRCTELVRRNLDMVRDDRGYPTNVPFILFDYLEKATLYENFRNFHTRWHVGPTIDDLTEIIVAEEKERRVREVLPTGCRVVILKPFRGMLPRGMIIAWNPRQRSYVVDMDDADRQIEVSEDSVRIESEPWMCPDRFLKIRGGGPMNFNGIVHSFERTKPRLVSFKYKLAKKCPGGIRGFCNFFLSSIETPYKDVPTFWLSYPPKPADTFTCLMSLSGEGAQMWLPSGGRVVLRNTRVDSTTDDEASNVVDSGPEQWHEVSMVFDWTTRGEERVRVLFDGKRCEGLGIVSDDQMRIPFSFPSSFVSDLRLSEVDARAVEAVKSGFRHLYIFSWLEATSTAPEIHITDIIIK